jgi:hypothetical protein
MTKTENKPRLQGSLEWSDGKAIHLKARFDKVALHHNRLFFISLVAFSPDVKAFRAGLAAGIDTPMRLINVTLTNGDESIEPGNAWPSTAGYRVDSHRLGFGSVHAIFTCRQPGFLLDGSDDALWRELKDDRFTTPLLRGWLPHIRMELETQNLLVRCDTFDCACCILTATSSDLDAIVESALKNGVISIQEEVAPAAEPA